MSADAPGLIETMRGDAAGIRFLARHLERLASSAKALDIVCDVDAVAAQVRRAAARIEGDSRVRVQLEPDGRFEAMAVPLPGLPPHPRVVVADERLDSRDPLLCHKTTRREIYERARAPLAGVEAGFDALLLNERGELCEGGISNVFLLVDGRLMTPPRSCGLLPGIMRRQVLETREATEAILRLDDLRRAQGIFLTNALRGMVQVTLVD